MYYSVVNAQTGEISEAQIDFIEGLEWPLYCRPISSELESILSDYGTLSIDTLIGESYTSNHCAIWKIRDALDNGMIVVECVETRPRNSELFARVGDVRTLNASDIRYVGDENSVWGSDICFEIVK